MNGDTPTHLKRQHTATQGRRYYAYKFKVLCENDNIEDIEQDFDDINDNHGYDSLDNGKHTSNGDIENGDIIEYYRAEYRKEFYDYYKECFEDLYEDY